MFTNVSKFKQLYTGETKNSIRDRMSDHVGYARSKKLDQTTGWHFNQPVYSSANMKITILEEEEKTNNIVYRKE